MRALAIAMLALFACGTDETPRGIMGGWLGGTGDPPPSIDLEAAWDMHIINAGVQGGSGFADQSDGIDLIDMDGDGDLDATSPYEQGGRASVSLNPGVAAVESPWSSAIIPTTGPSSPEEAIFADVDEDGWKDVVLSTEGGNRLWVIYSPTSAGSLLTPASWTRVQLDSSVGWRWMAAAVVDINGDGQLDIVGGGKEGAALATISWFTTATPRTAASWTKTTIVPVGWVMTLRVLDVDGDDDLDIVYTDRERIDLPGIDSTKMGFRWLENDGAASPTWTEHQIVNLADYKMGSLVDWEDDGDLDFVTCRSNSSGTNDHLIWKNPGSWGGVWTTTTVTTPTSVGQCQYGEAGDLDGDGDRDIVWTYAAADDDLSGVVWSENTGTNLSPTWARGEIDGSAGVKYDNAILFDIDGDADLDVVTSEQHADTDSSGAAGPGLGVIWFENP